MEIVQSFKVAHPPERVWVYFADVPAVASCMPGAEFAEQLDGQRYSGNMSVRLGPLAAKFVTEVTVTRDDSKLIGVVEGRGVDQRSNSRVQSKLTYTLAPSDGGNATDIHIKADIALAGALAQFGRSGIVQEVAARLTADFANNLHARLAAQSSAQAAAAPGVSAPAKELRAGSLLLAALWARIKRWLHLR
ncbi:MAG: SRPBCC family protein [Acidobacteriota bacterium]